MFRVACIDIGGTAIKYGVIDENKGFLCKYEIPTQARKGGKAILEKVITIIKGLRQFGPLGGIGIATAGMVDVEKGAIFYAGPQIPDYAGICFKETLEERFGIPCEVENDVNCAGLAEYVSGASRGSHSAVMLTVGTGIGGCIILDGKVVHGYSGSACEVGYMNLDGGMFQNLGATSVLTDKVAKRKREPKESWNGYRIFGAAKQGDPVCCQAIEEMADVLGKGIANICYVLNPEVVVLGGGIMAQGEYLKEKVEKSLEKYLVSGIFSKTKLAFARHGNDAGMLGAYYHFLERNRTEDIER